MLAPAVEKTPLSYRRLGYAARAQSAGARRGNRRAVVIGIIISPGRDAHPCGDAKQQSHRMSGGFFVWLGCYYAVAMQSRAHRANSSLERPLWKARSVADNDCPDSEEGIPKSASPFELEWELLAVFRLEFPSPQARNLWFQNSLRGALKVLTQSGDVERLHKAEKNAARQGRWRWNPPPAGAQTLAELSDLAEAAGIGTWQAPDEAPEET